jgi:hypothetical protein
MGSPAWLQNDGAWIAIGVSVLFVLAGVVMHRVFLNILKQPPGETPSPGEPPNESRHHE